MDIDRNFLLKSLLKNTFYAQLCAGKNKSEILKTLGDLGRIGCHGVILAYASEVLEVGKNRESVGAQASEGNAEAWRQGMLDTIQMTNKGDFVAMK